MSCLLLCYIFHFREKYPDGLKVGEVAFGKSGNLRCKELYHVALEKFTEARKDVNIKVPTVYI